MGRRSTTSKTFEISVDKEKVLRFAKRYHRNDGEFYVYYDATFEMYSSYSAYEHLMYNYEREMEHYVFKDGRWRLVP